MYRDWGRQGFLVKKNVQCHLINNADTFLKLAGYCPGLPVQAQLFQCSIDIFLFKIFACGKHFE